MNDNSEPNDAADNELLAQVRDAVLASDQPPARLRDAAMRAMTWDSDIELLLATFDSAKEPLSMRSAVTARDLTFSSDGLTVEISIEADGRDGTVLSGSVGGDSERIVLVQPGKPDRDLAVDQHGRFREPVAGSLAGVVMTTLDGRRMRTELFSLDPTTGSD